MVLSCYNPLFGQADNDIIFCLSLLNQALALLAKFSNRVTKAGSGDAEETSLSHLAKYSDDDADGDGGEKDSAEQPSKTAAATAADGEDDSGW